MRERGDKNLALIPYNMKPKSQITAKNPVKIVEDEEETDDSEETLTSGKKNETKTIYKNDDNKTSYKNDDDRTEIIVGQTPKPEKKVIKVENRFPSVVIKVKRPEGEPTRPRIVVNK
jgi:hypothetical protein